MATISLILTVYNRDRYLAAAMESVLGQTYPDFELLLWDDGSTDASLDIAQRYAQQDSRIHVTAAPHQGRTMALQAVHAQAKGVYVGWIDSDDMLAPTVLQATVEILDNRPQIGMVYTELLGNR